jgi:hypothetical protein
MLILPWHGLFEISPHVTVQRSKRQLPPVHKRLAIHSGGASADIMEWPLAAGKTGDADFAQTIDPVAMFFDGAVILSPIPH